ncbi:hypothetical protein P3C58_14850 [Mesorhizobium sp. XAP10]|uniref:hypothetical protein n=1 Tax=unclassified Mesorhizobium TaxID=325217 RepID=UPI0023DEF4FA|nr:MULTISPECIES: hypothetical protein [unclassified Mesorhizobium]MDF3153253.1 hypothetical protein [Mesorhizobium sp. XAP10]MDF3246449.1 hypothetical protein [Mesorhizobium sp. XAP4]
MSNLVHNEQVKLGATFFNNLGVAAFATGAIIPIVSLTALGKSDLATWLPFAGGAGIGVFFHYMGHRALRELKDD